VSDVVTSPLSRKRAELAGEIIGREAALNQLRARSTASWMNRC
jgi:hypothetical protein